MLLFWTQWAWYYKTKLRRVEGSGGGVEVEVEVEWSPSEPEDLGLILGKSPLTKIFCFSLNYVSFKAPLHNRLILV